MARPQLVPFLSNLQFSPSLQIQTSDLQAGTVFHIRFEHPRWGCLSSRGLSSPLQLRSRQAVGLECAVGAQHGGAGGSPHPHGAPIHPLLTERSEGIV